MPSAAAAKNILATFKDLLHSAGTTVRIHAGNETQLDIKCERVLQFLALLNQARMVFVLPLATYHSYTTFLPLVACKHTAWGPSCPCLM
jgi:hypothetical protein